MPPAKTIRTAARAVILHDDCLLLAKMKDAKGFYFILPGGGQRNGETLVETVRRECLEEVGARVQVKHLLYIREYIGRHHGFSPRHKFFHQLEHVFECAILNPDQLQTGSEPDNHQVGVEWVSLEEFAKARFYPAALQPFFRHPPFNFPQIYYGDCN